MLNLDEIAELTGLELPDGPVRDRRRLRDGGAGPAAAGRRRGASTTATGCAVTDGGRTAGRPGAGRHRRTQPTAPTSAAPTAAAAVARRQCARSLAHARIVLVRSRRATGRRPGCCPGSSRPRTPSTSATTSARSSSGWRCRTSTRRSTASSTCTRSPSTRRRRTSCASAPASSAAQLLAAGLDPDALRRCSCRATCPATPQLSWVLECITGFGEASRMTQFKDKSARLGGEHYSVGLFTYPMLQAADILLYQADAVPVGEDQRQHLELTRDLAQRFNTRYGDDVHRARAVHPEGHREDPRPAGPDREDEQVAAATRARSTCSTTPRRIARKIKRAVTDTETEVRYDPETKPGVSNLLTILAAVTDRDRRDGRRRVRRPRLRRAEGGTWPTRSSRSPSRSPSAPRELLDDPAELDAILAAGAERADAVAAGTVATPTTGSASCARGRR